MGRIVTISSQKGGVGKTTTALNLGYALSRLGGSVLLIDADPQASLATACQLKRRDLGLLDALREQRVDEQLLQYSRDGSLAVMASGATSAESAQELERLLTAGQGKTVLRQLGERFKHILIDAPSGVGLMVLGLLEASDGVLTPVQPKALTLRTLPLFVKTLQLVRRGQNPRLRLDGILLSMVDAENRAEGRVIEELRQLFPEDFFFQAMVPKDESFEDAASRGVPIMLLAGARRVARSYLELAMELTERSQLMEEVDSETAGLF